MIAQSVPGQEGDHNQPKVVERIMLPQRDAITGIQIGNALTIMGAITHTLVQLSEDKETDSKAIMDGGTKCALEATLIKASSRLDEILDDSKRWSTREQDTLEAKLKTVYKGHEKFLKAQTAAAEGINAPHRAYNASLVRTTNGKFIYYLGNLADPENSIIGVGNSAAEAAVAFDEVFKTNNVPPGMFAILKQLLEQNEQAPKPPGDSAPEGPEPEAPKKKK